MPYVTKGNIDAPTMMLAEKSADLILGNTPLEPIRQEFYRHGVTGNGSPQTAQMTSPLAADVPGQAGESAPASAEVSLTPSDN